MSVRYKTFKMWITSFRFSSICERTRMLPIFNADLLVSCEWDIRGMQATYSIRSVC